MPALTKPALEPFIHPSETTAALNWAPYRFVNVRRPRWQGATCAKPEAEEHSHGLGFLGSHAAGINPKEIDRQLAIGNAFFKQPLEEKRKVTCDCSLLFSQQVAA
ncbi:hypothetical protein C0991_006675 [Blastosporella zonata]|nr:hypothetical protein C0991_006675 [Blastosporella zonata]